MADKAATRIARSTNLEVWRWGPFGASDTPLPIGIRHYADVTVYLLKGSAFGGNCGFSISPMIEDETEIWVTPTDSNGVAISTKTADGGWLITESAVQLKPTVAAGADAVYAYAVCHMTG